MGGERGVLRLQSSGVGNGINMLALDIECWIPLLALVTIRGEWGEFNPGQVPMGQAAQDALETAGVVVARADRRATVDALWAAGGIMPIVEINGRAIGDGKPGPLPQRVHELCWALRESGRHGTPIFPEAAPRSAPVSSR